MLLRLKDAMNSCKRKFIQDLVVAITYTSPGIVAMTLWFIWEYSSSVVLTVFSSLLDTYIVFLCVMQRLNLVESRLASICTLKKGLRLFVSCIGFMIICQSSGPEIMHLMGVFPSSPLPSIIHRNAAFASLKA